MTTIAAAAPDELASRLMTVFRGLLQTIPDGAAKLGSTRTTKNDGTIVWLKPSNRRAAEFSAHIEDGNPSLIDVSFGTTTTFELTGGSALPSDASFETILKMVREIGLAVIAGECRGYLGFLGVRGTIHVGSQKPLQVTSFFHPRLIPKLVQYAPYVEHV
jgi:hypothetical protein